MFSAVASVLGKTIDIFLKINSAEGRRRRFGKDVFAIHTNLNQVAYSLDRLAATARHFASQGDAGWLVECDVPSYVIIGKSSSDGIVELQTIELAPDGSERLSPVWSVKHADILPSVLAKDIKRLSLSISEVAEIMKAESWNLFQLEDQPAMLKALGIFDVDIVRTFNKAWFADGGFVQALHYLGLYHDIDGNVLKLVDAQFDPMTSLHGYEIKGTASQFSLENAADVDAFLALCESCKKSVEEARDAVKAFISKNLKIEDII